MLDIAQVRAITLDLDDTLWPIWPTIERAELELGAWLAPRAPVTAKLLASADERLALRQALLRSRPEIAHDMSAMRLALIREALRQSVEDEMLAEPAFEVFFAARMRVNLFDDALPALEMLSRHFPVVALSNGNADVHRVGIGAHFAASVSAHQVGLAKPDPRIFHAAATAAGVLPEQVLHVGDDAVLDVIGARDAGMQTVWVNRGASVWGHAVQPHATVTGLDELCRLLQLQMG